MKNLTKKFFFTLNVLLRGAIGVRQSRTNISDISATGIDAVTAVLEATRKIGIVLVMPSVSV